ncbi:MAG: four helix bundle protein [Bacteroidales bacterium]|nr:four helix bundle protein [Bacteroidales bacterium]
MFDFEKLQVYEVVREQNKKVMTFLRENSKNIDPFVVDQWKKASLNSVILLAEGTGKRNISERRQYFANARGNIFVCTTLLQLVKDQDLIDEETYSDYYQGYEKASKMLLGMFKPRHRNPQGIQQDNSSNF